MKSGASIKVHRFSVEKTIINALVDHFILKIKIKSRLCEPFDIRFYNINKIDLTLS